MTSACMPLTPLRPAFTSYSKNKKPLEFRNPLKNHLRVAPCSPFSSSLSSPLALLHFCALFRISSRFFSLFRPLHLFSERFFSAPAIIFVNYLSAIIFQYWDGIQELSLDLSEWPTKKMSVFFLRFIIQIQSYFTDIAYKIATLRVVGTRIVKLDYPVPTLQYLELKVVKRYYLIPNYLIFCIKS